jgi:hypothetical protein
MAFTRRISSQLQFDVLKNETFLDTGTYDYSITRSLYELSGKDSKHNTIMSGNSIEI